MIESILSILAFLIPFILESVKSQKNNKDIENVQKMREFLQDDGSLSIDAHASDQHDRVQRALRGD